MATFSLITACILLGMLSIRFWHVSGGILFHSSTTLSHNSCTPLGGCGYFLRAFFSQGVVDVDVSIGVLFKVLEDVRLEGI